MVLQRELCKKFLLIPSILLTKVLISSYVSTNSRGMNQALNYLLEKQLLTSGKYLECGRRKIEAYLKYVPNNIEDRKDKYLLQRKLLDVDVNVNDYLKSLKMIKLVSTSLLPSTLLIRTLQEIPYVQLNINLSIKCGSIYITYLLSDINN